MKHLNPIELKGDDDAPEAIVQKALDDLSKTVDERLKAVEEKQADETLSERLDKLEAKANRPAGKASDGDDQPIETKAINTFIRNGAAVLDEAEKKALNIGTDTAGGHMVAPEYSTSIIEGLLQWSPMRAVASVMNIGTTKVYIPQLTTRLEGTWVAETGARQESQPVFGQVEIDVHEHAVIVPISRQLLEDSMVDLSAYLQGQITQMFGKAEATAFLTGDGNGKPLGLLDSTQIAGYQATVAAADGSDIIDKVIEGFHALPGPYASRGAWMMNRATMGIIRAAADTTTKGTLWSDGLADGTPARLLGRPVYDAVDMDNLEADGIPIAFGDFASGYQIVDRFGIQIMRDDYTGADNGIVKIRARRRTGGKPVLQEAVHLITGPSS